MEMFSNLPLVVDAYNNYSVKMKKESHWFSVRKYFQILSNQCALSPRWRPQTNSIYIIMFFACALSSSIAYLVLLHWLTFIGLHELVICSL